MLTEVDLGAEAVGVTVGVGVPPLPGPDAPGGLVVAGGVAWGAVLPVLPCGLSAVKS